MTPLWLLIAYTLWYEARGEPFEGKRLVASVIWNRAEGKSENIRAVILKPKQFSCWNDYDWSQPLDLSGPVYRNKAEVEAWLECCRIARSMESGKFVRTTMADHYHAVKIKKVPAWAKEMKRVATVWGHVFYQSKGRG